MAALPEELAHEWSKLFHDVAPAEVDPDEHSAFVIARVLDRGTMRSVRALVRLYGQGRLREFFSGPEARRVSPSTRAPWRNVLGLPVDRCEPTSSARISSPFWNE